MSALIDGGDRVLFESDVDVSAVTAWVEPASETSEALVFRLVREGDREDVLNNVAVALRDNKSALHEVLYRPRLAELKRLPTQTIAYWAPPAINSAHTNNTLRSNRHTAKVRQGLATGDDERFLRYWWEVPADQIGEGKRWVPFAKGGDYSPFYENTLRVIDWKDDERPESSAQRGMYLKILAAFTFVKGITFPNIADRFHARHLQASVNIWSHGAINLWYPHPSPLLAYLNSKIAQVLLMAQSVNPSFRGRSS